MDKTGSSGLLNEYIELFLRTDKLNAIYFCKKWCTSFNGKQWRSCEPDDIIFRVLEAILEGRRRCYLDTYEHFRGSVYFAIKSELMNIFGKKEKIIFCESSPENFYLPESSEEKGFYYDEDIILEKIDSEMVIKNIEALFNPGKEKEELRVFRELLKGGKRGEIACVLGLDKLKVTNIQKRIYRKIKKRIKPEMIIEMLFE